MANVSRRQSLPSFATWTDAKEQPDVKPIRRIWFDELCLAIGRRAPPLQKLGHVNGTMAAFTQTVASTSRVLLWADAFLRGASQVVLTNNPISGALILGGLFGHP